MSTPAAGYPDYQNLPQWRGNTMLQGFHAVSIASPQTAQGYVTNWQSMNVNVLLEGVAGVTASITYYTDATLAHQIGVFGWVIGVSGGQVAVLTPNLGNYVVILVSTAEAGNHPVQMAIGPINVPVPRAEYQVTNNAVEELAISIGAGASLTVASTDVVAGDGYYMVSQAGGTVGFDVQVSQVGENGGISHYVAEAFGGVTVKSGNFQVSEFITQITVTNHDVVARNFDIFMSTIGR